jgi:DNA-binding XRE family transcriptional regulator
MAGYRELTLRCPELLNTLMRDRHTNRSLAEEVGCSYAMIGHLRTGTRRSCRRRLAVHIAKALGVTVETLFDLANGSAPEDPGNGTGKAVA